MTDVAPPTNPAPAASTGAPAERGWGKLLIALAAFLFLPAVPQLRAFLPVDQTMMLFVPAMAACALVGWWAGGRAFTAIAWVVVAVLVTARPAAPGAFDNLARGWSLLLAGTFGLVSLFGFARPFFARALIALGGTLGLAFIMSLVGPVTVSRATKSVADEFTRRNAETSATINGAIQTHPKEWSDLLTKFPQLGTMQADAEKELTSTSDVGLALFPALLALQSLAALALAWATYHRLARARLGPPLGALREFRFNDQLVWGLIVGLTVVLLPTLISLRGAGKNLLVFFGALYALRGFGVLTWFMAPGSLGITLGVGFVMLLAPVVNVFAALVFMMLGVAALALGLGDTWADWRRRARAPL